MKKLLSIIMLLGLVACGQPGPAGIDGINGNDGTNGINGNDGVQGEQGPQGVQGDPGFLGWGFYYDNVKLGLLAPLGGDAALINEEGYIVKLGYHSTGNYWVLDHGYGVLDLVMHVSSDCSDSNPIQVRGKRAWDSEVFITPIKGVETVVMVDKTRTFDEVIPETFYHTYFDSVSNSWLCTSDEKSNWDTSILEVIIPNDATVSGWTESGYLDADLVEIK